MPGSAAVIDDLTSQDLFATTGTGWALISDRVMGGVSNGALRREAVEGRPAIRMRGGVSLENNGGFLQMALDLGEAGAVVDATGWTGIQLEVLGNGQTYNLHLRTTDIQRPWESYRQSFNAPREWTTVHLSFGNFAPHRTEKPLRLTGLRRIGLVAIGREFDVDLAFSDIRFYGSDGAGATGSSEQPWDCPPVR